MKRGDKVVAAQQIFVPNISLDDFAILSPRVDEGTPGTICKDFYRMGKTPRAGMLPVAFELPIPEFGELLLRVYVHESELKKAAE